MSKVIKAYSLDLETVNILENYCSASDNWDRRISRSKVVNDSIRWFITGDVAELVHGNEMLQKKFSEAMIEKHDSMDSKPTNRPWWRRLLLGQ